MALQICRLYQYQGRQINHLTKLLVNYNVIFGDVVASLRVCATPLPCFADEAVE